MQQVWTIRGRDLPKAYDNLRDEMARVYRERRETIKSGTATEADLAYYDGLLEGLSWAAERIFGPHGAWQLKNEALERARA